MSIRFRAIYSPFPLCGPPKIQEFLFRMRDVVRGKHRVTPSVNTGYQSVLLRRARDTNLICLQLQGGETDALLSQCPLTFVQ